MNTLNKFVLAVTTAATFQMTTSTEATANTLYPTLVGDDFTVALTITESPDTTSPEEMQKIMWHGVRWGGGYKSINHASGIANSINSAMLSPANNIDEVMKNIRENIDGIDPASLPFSFQQGNMIFTVNTIEGDHDIRSVRVDIPKTNGAVSTYILEQGKDGNAHHKVIKQYSGGSESGFTTYENGQLSDISVIPYTTLQTAKDSEPAHNPTYVENNNVVESSVVETTQVGSVVADTAKSTATETSVIDELGRSISPSSDSLSDNISKVTNSPIVEEELILTNAPSDSLMIAIGSNTEVPANIDTFDFGKIDDRADKNGFILHRLPIDLTSIGKIFHDLPEIIKTQTEGQKKRSEERNSLLDSIPATYYTPKNEVGESELYQFLCDINYNVQKDSNALESTTFGREKKDKYISLHLDDNIVEITTSNSNDEGSLHMSITFEGNGYMAVKGFSLRGTSPDGTMSPSIEYLPGKDEKHTIINEKGEAHVSIANLDKKTKDTIRKQSFAMLDKVIKEQAAMIKAKSE